MLQWFVYLIPGLVLLITLVVAKAFNVFVPGTYDLVASVGFTETEVGAGGGLIKVEDRLIFVETYGTKIGRGRKVLVVKYIPEEGIYMVEPYI